jgi:hypothetical protein
MNTDVTATGMQVTAKGDQVYLQIINETSAVVAEKTFQDGAAQRVAHTTLQSAEMLPVNVVDSRVETEVEGKKRYLSCVDYAGANNLVWVTNVGESTTVGTASTDYTDVTEAANTANGKYYLKNTFKIRLDPTAGADAAAAPLHVGAITTTSSADAFKGCLSVLIVSTIDSVSYGQVWAYDTATSAFAKQLGADNLSSGVFGTSVATVDIYVFFNGDDADCTQEKLAAATAANYDVEIQFTVA